MSERYEQNRNVLAAAVDDFMYLRTLAEQIERAAQANETAFLLAQIAVRIARDGEKRIDSEIDRLDAAELEVRHG